MTTGRLSIELLEAFVAVAKSGNVTHAGLQLNRTQPCISTQIKRLEERVGKPLIERSARTMGLTQAGRILLDSAKIILEEYEAARVRLSVPELTGEIHVGLPEWYATNHPQSVFCSFIRAHPNVHLFMTIADSATLHNQLASNEMNLAIALVSSTRPQPSEIVEEPLVWVAGQNCKLVDPLPLILFPEPCPFRDAIFNGLSSVNRHWHERFTTTSVATAQVAISSDVGITAIPAGAVQSNFRILGERDGFPQIPATRLAVYTPSPKQSQTVDYLAEHLSDFLRKTILRNSSLVKSSMHNLRVV